MKNITVYIKLDNYADAIELTRLLSAYKINVTCSSVIQKSRLLKEDIFSILNNKDWMSTMDIYSIYSQRENAASYKSVQRFLDLYNETGEIEKYSSRQRGWKILWRKK